MSEIYFSCDVETDGPIPGPHSMLSIGCAAFDERGKMLDTFSRNLETLPGAEADPDTWSWWQKNLAAYETSRVSTVPPTEAMKDFVAWVNTVTAKNGNRKPVFVAYPAGFDFLFAYWYMIRHGCESPFSFSALDIKTYAAAVLKVPYRDATKRNMPKRWFSRTPHTHVAVDDAIEQGELFCNMMLENKVQGDAAAIAMRLASNLLDKG